MTKLQIHRIKLAATVGLVLFALAVLSGCATTTPIDDRLNSWLGLPVTQYIATNGPPTSSYAAGDLTYLTWHSSFTTNGGYQTTCNDYGYGPICTTNGGPQTYSCTINLTVDSLGTIIAWRAKGIC